MPNRIISITLTEEAYLLLEAQRLANLVPGPQLEGGGYQMVPPYPSVGDWIAFIVRDNIAPVLRANPSGAALALAQQIAALQLQMQEATSGVAAVSTTDAPEA